MYYVMGTGSRGLIIQPQKVRAQVYETLYNKLLEFKIEKSDRLVVISGMAEGWDEFIAEAAFELDIPFLAFVPHPTYGEYYWGKNSLTGENRLRQFGSLLEKAYEVRYTSDRNNQLDQLLETAYKVQNRSNNLYINGVHVNLIRNGEMVDISDYALVYDAKSRGTKDAVRKLEKASVPYEVYPFE